MKADVRSSIRPPRALIQSPPVAWPTIVLSAATTAAWIVTLVLAWRGDIGPWLACAASTLAAFVAFTPMHDAAHRSVARRPWVNEVVGRLGGLLLAGPFPAFRYVHLEHHKHTNEPGLDPDEWSGRGPAWLRPLRWVTQDLHYYVIFAMRWRSRPVAERWEMLGMLAAIALACGAAVASGQGAWIVACWLLPSRLALVLLAFGFDYLPHRPHRVPARVDPFAATSVDSTPLLTPLFLYQNYHLVHHLFPGVPFYGYSRVWWAERDAFLAAGARDLR